MEIEWRRLHNLVNTLKPQLKPVVHFKGLNFMVCEYYLDFFQVRGERDLIRRKDSKAEKSIKPLGGLMSRPLPPVKHALWVLGSLLDTGVL